MEHSIITRKFTKPGFDMRATFPPSTRTAQIIRADGSVKFQQEDVEAPLMWSDHAVTMAASKYFYGQENTDERETSVYEMVNRVARANASWMGFRLSKKEYDDGVLSTDPDISFCMMDLFPFPDDEGTLAIHSRPPDTRLDQIEVYFRSYTEWRAYLDELKFILISQRALFNSPVWFNVGTEGEQQCSACFITRVEDYFSGEGDHGILKIYETEAKLFKNGSGSGHEISRMRSSREGVKGGGTASGGVSFSRGHDRSGRTVRSGGRVRRAAMMRTCMVDYGDIMEFITVKVREEKKARALAAAGYGSGIDSESYDTVAFQGANFSVRVSDDFMMGAQNDSLWELVSRTMVGAPKNPEMRTNMLGERGYVIDKVLTGHIFDEMAKACWECGDPGIQFDTIINDWHTCLDTEKINSSNPCSEFMFLDKTACNLASLNLLMFIYDGKFRELEFTHTVQVMITAMEGWVSCADYPDDIITDMSEKYRPLGLGYGNLGALLMKMAIPYDSQAGRDMAATIASLMCATAYHQSALIAERMGAFPEYDKNVDSFLRVMDKHVASADTLKKRIPDDWDCYDIAVNAQMLWEDAISLIKQFGCRNSQATAIAPMGTIGLVMDCETMGIEPYLALVQYKKLVGGGEMRLVCKQVGTALAAMGYPTEDVVAIVDMLAKGRPTEGIPGLAPEDLSIFDTSFYSNGGTRALSWRAHVKMLGAVQPFISGSISKTINMPEDSAVEDIKEAMLLGWRLGLKCMAIYRDNCKLFQPASTKSGESKEEMEPKAEVATTQLWKKLPSRIPAERFDFRVGEHGGYIHYGFDPEVHPQEKKLVEAFLTMDRVHSTIDGWVKCFGILLSYLIRSGFPLKKVVKKIKDMEFEPMGFTSDPEIRNAKSIPGYVLLRMALDFLPEEELAELGIQRPPEELEDPDEDGDAPETPPVPSGEAIAPSTPSRAQSYSGRVCGGCGSFNVVMEGSSNCFRCLDCGDTEGGCGG